MIWDESKHLRIRILLNIGLLIVVEIYGIYGHRKLLAKWIYNDLNSCYLLVNENCGKSWPYTRSPVANADSDIFHWHCSIELDPNATPLCNWTLWDFQTFLLKIQAVMKAKLDTPATTFSFCSGSIAAHCCFPPFITIHHNSSQFITIHHNSSHLPLSLGNLRAVIFSREAWSPHITRNSGCRYANSAGKSRSSRKA